MTYLTVLLITSTGHAHLDRQRYVHGTPWSRVWRRRKFWQVPCTECTGQGMNELIPAVKMDSVEGYFGNEFPSICNHCGVMAAWSRKTLKKSILCVFWKNNLLRKIFQRYVPKWFIAIPTTCCVQISWNLADGKLVKSWVANPALATARIARKIRQSQPQTMYSACSRFHHNRFTFGRVIRARVNTIKTGRKVFPILGLSLASSQIKMSFQCSAQYSNSRPTACYKHVEKRTTLKVILLIFQLWLELMTNSGVGNLITFRVSRRPREMYCGHARLCVCLCVCPQPHAYTIARTRM